MLNETPYKALYTKAFGKHYARQNVFRLTKLGSSINIRQYNTFVNSTDKYDILNIFGDPKKTE